MKVFISHKKEDELAAMFVAHRLRLNSVDFWVDAVDPVIDSAGDEIGDYIRGRLSTCTHLIAVVSTHTRGSWWVPWEIGVATEKEYPIATFVTEECQLPEYLKKWPYLRHPGDIDVYVRVSAQARTNADRLRLAGRAQDAQKAFAQSFHRELKRALGQP